VLHWHSGKHADRSAVSTSRCFRDDAAAIIAHRKETVFSITHHAESAFNSAHHRQVSMPIGIDLDTLIPRRYENQTNLLFRIPTGQFRIIHISADFDSDSPYGLSEG